MELNPIVNYKKITSNIKMRNSSLNRAISSLNNRQPEHPPDTFFIRRNTSMLNKYLNENEYNKLLTRVPTNFQDNF